MSVSTAKSTLFDRRGLCRKAVVDVMCVREEERWTPTAGLVFASRHVAIYNKEETSFVSQKAAVCKEKHSRKIQGKLRSWDETDNRASQDKARQKQRRRRVS